VDTPSTDSATASSNVQQPTTAADTSAAVS